MELLKKLHVNADKPVWLINAPDNCFHYFDTLEVKQKLGKEKPIGQIILFAYDSKELADYMLRLAGYISPDTLIWICYPKKTGSISSDLILTKSWDTVFQSGYRGQTSVSVDDDWSGMRITNAPRKKPSDCNVPMAERKTEGIDYVNRTVKLPPDAEAALRKHKGMAGYFYSQSFTCKKEHLLAIADAKKEDTRIRRIDKMIEMLQEKIQMPTAKRAILKKPES